MDMSRRRMLSTSALGTVAFAAAAQTGTSGARAQGPAAGAPLKLQVLLFDGFEITDGLAPYDVLKVSSNGGARFQTSLVALGDAPEVKSLHDVVVKPNAAFDESADILVLPGAPQLWRNNIQPPGLDVLLQKWVAAGKVLATVCTGAVLAARTGVLKGRNVATHRAAHEVIKATGVNLIPNAKVVDDGNVLSSGGVIAGVDLAIYMIDRFYGAQAALAAETIFEYERHGVVWRAPK
ncbi:MAG: DJ-1/PfpI family protein [Polyangiales bacterium]